MLSSAFSSVLSSEECDLVVYFRGMFIGVCVCGVFSSVCPWYVVFL